MRTYLQKDAGTITLSMEDGGDPPPVRPAYSLICGHRIWCRFTEVRKAEGTECFERVEIYDGIACAVCGRIIDEIRSEEP